MRDFSPSIRRTLVALSVACLIPIVTARTGNASERTMRLESASTPFSKLSEQLHAVLRGRSGRIDVALDDLSARHNLIEGVPGPQYEASVVKVDILLALLDETRGKLSSEERAAAVSMIEESDNASATALWYDAGGNKGIARFNAAAGLTGTSLSPCVVCRGFPWPGWGLSKTTGLDELRLLRLVAIRNTLVPDGARSFAISLMRHVVPWEQWGVSEGPTPGYFVALKNGWLPLNGTDTDWQINSVGWVVGKRASYALAVFSSGNPSEGYGIETANKISAIVWHFLGPRS